MIHMDANTEGSQEKKRETWDISLHNNSTLLYNASSRSFIIIIFCERLIEGLNGVVAFTVIG